MPWPHPRAAPGELDARGADRRRPAAPGRARTAPGRRPATCDAQPVPPPLRAGRRVTAGGARVVVGAGHNGLVCACTLAERGVPVTVLEHSPKPGGGVRSGEPGLPGFVHDHCAGFVPVAHASPAMQAMELERYGVEWIAPETVMAHPFADGTASELNADVATTARSLERSAPGAGAAWTGLMDRLLPHAETIS